MLSPGSFVRRWAVVVASIGVTACAWGGEPAPPADAPAGTLRSGPVTIDVGAIARGLSLDGEAVKLAFFDDVAVAMLVEHASERPEGFTLLGRIVGEPESAAVVTVERGQVAAGVWSRAGVYELTPTGRPAGAGLAECIASQRDPAKLVECLHDARPPEPRVIERAPARDGKLDDADRATPSDAAGGGAHRGQPAGCECPDDPSVVDVLCVYTGAALAGAGGEAALAARIQNAFDTANMAFTNSGIDDLSMNLVGTEPIIYDEVSPEWLDHLERITAPADGFMDNVHALRDLYAADCVMLIVEDARFTGGAAWYAVSDDGAAFSCLNWRSVGGGILTPAHEWGHNFGCAHDRGNSAFSPFTYAWGYHFFASGTEYGDIMSYTGQTIPFFSNPHLTFLGEPIGAPLSDPEPAHNALAISQTRWVLANYRTSGRTLDCNNNGVADSTDISTGTSDDLNGNGRPDECEHLHFVDADAAGGAGEGLSWAEAHTDLAEALDVARLRCSNIHEVWVADGTYLPDRGTGDHFASFPLASCVALYGGFEGQSGPGGGETMRDQRDPAANETILSGDIGVIGDNADNTYSVVTAYGVDASAVLDGFTVTLGNSFGDAGGLYCSDSEPTVANCLFTNNRAEGSGGAVMLVDGSAISLDNCVFSGNAAGFYGGGLGVWNGSAATLTACRFENNTAQYGGAVLVDFSSSVGGFGCEMTGNTAEFGSGAADVYGDSTLTLESSVLSQNHALNGAGGAITGSEGSGVFLDGCVVSGNDAAQSGGGLAVWDSTAAVSASEFLENQATYGGALLVVGSTGSLFDGVTFSGNTAAFDGGAAEIAGSVVTFAGCTIAGNSATAGGGGAARLVAASDATFEDCRFDGNSSLHGGGGIQSYDGSFVGLLRSTFDGNSSASGGALTLLDSTLRADACEFVGNTATGAGGVGGAADLWATDAVIANSLVRLNTTVGDHGGGIWIDGNTLLTVSNATIYGNIAASAGAGIAQTSGTTLSVANSILWQNAAGGGGASVEDKQVFRFGMAARTVSYSCIDGLSTLAGSGNIGLDPMFAAAGAGDFSLSTGSPCLDAGNSSLIALDALDSDGDGVTTEPAPLDLLGMPRRFDSGAPDCPHPPFGCGPAPVVDMGAIESQDAAPPCPGDWNGDGVRNTADFFEFFGDFFGTPPDADYNGDGMTNTADFFEFFADFFGPPC